MTFQCSDAEMKVHPSSIMKQRNAGNWCDVVTPGFNNLVLFHTKTPGQKGFNGPYHKVNVVTKKAPANFHRFGATGWLVHKRDEAELYRHMPPRTQLSKDANTELKSEIQNAAVMEKLRRRKSV